MNELQHLVAEAVALAGGDLCVAGHDWQSIGGRGTCDDCPVEKEIQDLYEMGMRSHRQAPSQPVYQCARCGAWDYGDRGGPGHADCVTFCGRDDECT